MADERQDFSASHRVMVIEPDTDMYMGEQKKGAAAVGSVFHYTKYWGDWLYVPMRDAWVKTDRVIPIEDAESHFTRDIERDPTAAAYHHRGIVRHELGFHELALADLEEALKRGENTPALFINRANVWHSLGNDQNALSDISLAIKAHPENALARNNRGLIHAAMGDFDRAIEDASEAIRLSSESAPFYNNRGVSRVKLGDFKSAISDYDAAIERNEDYAEAYANRGYAAKRLGDFAKALEDYRRAMELAPESPQAFNDAAWLMATCPDDEFRDTEQAIDLARHACEMTKFKNADFIDTLAAACAAAGRFDDAVKSQQQAITLMPHEARESAHRRLERYRQGQPFVEGQ